MMLHDMEYPFGQLGSAGPAVSLPNVLATPLPPSCLYGKAGKGQDGKQESLGVVQVLFSNSQNIAVLPALFQPQIQGTKWAADIDFILARPSIVINHESSWGQEESLSGTSVEVSY